MTKLIRPSFVIALHFLQESWIALGIPSRFRCAFSSIQQCVVQRTILRFSECFPRLLFTRLDYSFRKLWAVWSGRALHWDCSWLQSYHDLILSPGTVLLISRYPRHSKLYWYCLFKVTDAIVFYFILLQQQSRSAFWLCCFILSPIIHCSHARLQVLSKRTLRGSVLIFLLSSLLSLEPHPEPHLSPFLCHTTNQPSTLSIPL